MELKKQKFPIWKSLLSSSYTKTSLTVKFVFKVAVVCKDTRVVEHTTVKLLGQWCSGRSNATPWWDAVSSGRHRESCYGRCVAGTCTTPHSPWDLGQGYWVATATMRWNLVYCETKTPRCHHYVITRNTSCSK